ncbi:hypothetical protein ABZ434_26100 [Streptomyces sp. NPDC005761]|uniref:hypothetical protein n=1 Tax=unclassified Streptomyces TaxID=2593676 RepID=UPI0033E692AF
MVEIYVPKFIHKDWIDNQDRVRAGGDEGLNNRFHRLEDEFAGLANNQINPIIRGLARPVMHLTLVPVLTPYPDPNAGGDLKPTWNQALDMVEKPEGKTEAHGFMNVVLPDGVKVTSLLMTGTRESSAGSLTAVLKNREIHNSSGADPVLTADALDTPGLPGSEVVINNETHRYFLTLDVEGAGANKALKVFCIQLTYG